ncbi:hypothetical protein ABI59_05245 [Acidobacteria bacterium Mor1]|nr:hypothetical protein ABI59_05245 [Acidobacteria bacterium Mor1]
MTHKGDSRPTGRVDPERRRAALEEQELRPGALFAGRYKIVERIGRGGMGQVYRAADQWLSRVVALKVIAEPAPDSGESFEQRPELLLHLDHPALVRNLDLGEESGQPYLVSEYLEGESLAERLRRDGPMDFAAALSVVVPVLSALEYLHGRGVTHRDIKPHNVMLTDEGVRVVDYGLARRMGIPDAGATAEGTREYMAPEVAAGEAVDHRADLYSCAALCHEALAGEPPAGPEGVSESLPPSVRGVLLQALSPDPAHRFQSAGKMQQALESIERHPDRFSLYRSGGHLRIGRAGRRIPSDFGQVWLPMVLAALLMLFLPAGWAWKMNDRAWGLEVEGATVRVVNVWGRQVASLMGDAPVTDALLVDREGSPTLLVARGAEGRGSATIRAFGVDCLREACAGRGLRPLALPPDSEPVRLFALRRSGDRTPVVSLWYSPEEDESAIVLLDDAGGDPVLGNLGPRRVWGPAGLEIQAAAFEPGSLQDPRERLWVAGRHACWPAEIFVGMLELPAVDLAAWTRIPGDSRVDGVELSARDIVLVGKAAPRRIRRPGRRDGPEWKDHAPFLDPQGTACQNARSSAHVGL